MVTFNIIFSSTLDIPFTSSTTSPESNTKTTTTPSGNNGTVKPGEVLTSGAKATWYDAKPGVVDINGNGDGLTSTGEKFDRNEFTAAAFPELLELLPDEYVTRASGFRGGLTLKKPVNIVVKDQKTGKTAVIKLNDVGPGVSGHASNHMLDLSPAARDYFGSSNIANGLEISLAPAGSEPGATSTIA